jgi:hypothetical protein
VLRALGQRSEQQESWFLEGTVAHANVIYRRNEYSKPASHIPSPRLAPAPPQRGSWLGRGV